MRTLERSVNGDFCHEQFCIFKSLNVKHQHFPSNVRSWGVLERFVVRTKELLGPIQDCCHLGIEHVHANRHQLPPRAFDVYCDRNRDALKFASKKWLICSMYWPAYLFGASRRIGWSRRQQQAVFTITREFTRSLAGNTKTQAATINNAQIVTAGRGERLVSCPLLDPSNEYVVFGGNPTGSSDGANSFPINSASRGPNKFHHVADAF